jgi:hypothetical protein
MAKLQTKRVSMVDGLSKVHRSLLRTVWAFTV